ncbi:AAA family ATPase [Desulfosarcina cetonica]
MPNFNIAPKQHDHDAQAPMPADMDPVTAFTVAMAEHGLNPGEIVADGNIQRFDVDKPGDKAGWYSLHLDGVPAGAFGNFKGVNDQTWCAKKRHEMTDAEWAENKRRIDDAKRQREADAMRRWQAARDRLKPVFDAAEPADHNHQHLVRKGVKPYGDLRQAGELLLWPLHDENFEFWSYQELYPEKKVFHPGEKPRDKHFPGGGRQKGCFGYIPGDGPPIICEGFSTGATIHEATGRPVYTALTAGNILAVARIIREKCPTDQITIAGDDDRWKPELGNAGRKYAEQAAKEINAKVVFPSFKDVSGKPTDFNDLASAEGIDAVKRVIDGAGANYLKDAILTTGDFKKIEVPPKTYSLFPWLWDGCYGMISGPRGCGKTWFITGVADAITRGESFGPWKCHEPKPCTIIDGEMPMGDYQERIDLIGLDGDRDAPLYLLSDAYVCEILKRPSINLGCEETRKLLREVLLDCGVKTAFFDNVASLTPGMDENSKQEWDPINQWLIGLRYAGISPWLIHHLGKSGDQRGTSGREDNIDISIRLMKPTDYQQTDGARFVVSFTKKRISHKWLPLVSDLEMQCRPDDNGKYIWTFGNPAMNKELSVLNLLICDIPQKDIAKELQISTGQVSKIRKKLTDCRMIEPGNILTVEGKNALVKAGFDV